MDSNLIRQAERYIKSVLKKKASVTQGLIVAFMIAGSFVGISRESFAWEYIIVGEGAIYTRNDSDSKIIEAKDAIALNPNAENANKTDISTVGDYSIAIGSKAKAIGTNSVAIGKGATSNQEDGIIAIGSGTIADGMQSIAIGMNTKALGSQALTVGARSGSKAQAVAVGTDIYANGVSSIALGNDDLISGVENDKNIDESQRALFSVKLPLSTIKKVYKDLYGPAGFLTEDEFGNKYIAKNHKKPSVDAITNTDIESSAKLYNDGDTRVYSPTYAGGRGSIAIGSRTVAAQYLSTSIGSLSFSLAPKSTTMGYLAYVDSDASGGTAIGDNSYVFAKDSIAIGNKTEATNTGSIAYGNKSYAVSDNSVVLGVSSVGGGKFSTKANIPIPDTKKMGDNIIYGNGMITKEVNLEDAFKFQYAMLSETHEKLENKFKNLENNNPKIEELINSGKTIDDFLTLGKNGNEYVAISVDEIKKMGVEQSDANTIHQLASKLADARNFLFKSSDRIFAPKDGDGIKDYLDTIGEAKFTLGTKEIKTLAKGAGAQNNIVLGNRSLALNTNSMSVGYSSFVAGRNSLGVGAFSYVDNNADNSMALGTASYVAGKNALAVGTFATANGNKSVAIGNTSTAEVGANSTIVLGDGSKADKLAARAVVMGADAYSNAKETISIGKDTNIASGAYQTIGIGYRTKALEKATNSTGVGTQVTVAGQKNSAYGYLAKTAGENSIAIGSEVYSNVALDMDARIDNLGNPTSTGEFNIFGLLKSDLDGVAKLKGKLNQPLASGGYFGNKVEGDSEKNNYINKLEKALSASNFLRAKKGTITAEGQNSIVIGSSSAATGNNSAALGRGAFAFGDNAFALGSYAFADKTNAVAFGATAKALAENSIVIGIGSGVQENAAGTTILGIGSYAKDAKNGLLLGSSGRIWNGKDVTIIGNNASGGGDNNVLVGTNSQLYGSNNAAFGSNIKAINALDGTGAENNLLLGNNTVISPGVNQSSAIGFGAVIGENSTKTKEVDKKIVEDPEIYKIEKATALGYMAKVTKDSTREGHGGNQALALGANAIATLNNSVALGVDSRTDYEKSDLEKPGWIFPGAVSIPTNSQTGVISVGSSAGERRIVNVASGYKDTDAVNVAQLKTLYESLKIDIDDVNGGSKFLSISKNNQGEIGKTYSKITARENLDKYISLKGALLKIKLRQIAGETFNSDAVNKVEKRVEDLNKLLVDAKITTTELAALNSMENKINKLSEEEAKKVLDSTTKDIDTKMEEAKKAGAPGINEAEIEKLKNDTNYNNNLAYGADSIAIGYMSTTTNTTESTAGGKQGIAVGFKTSVAEEKGIAIGSEVKSTGKFTIAIGSSDDINNENKRNEAFGENSIALGRNTRTVGVNSVAVGFSAKAAGELAVSVGAIYDGGQGATKVGAIAIGGDKIKATGEEAIAIGRSAEATAADAIAIGNVYGTNPNTPHDGIGDKVTAGAERAVALGNGAKVNTGAVDALALGTKANIGASAINGIALGREANVTAANGIAIGAKNPETQVSTTAAGLAIALGNGAQALSSNSVAIGTKANVNTTNGETGGIAIGLESSVTGNKSSVAIGKYSKAATSGNPAQGYYLEGTTPMATTDTGSAGKAKISATHTPTYGEFAIGDINKNGDPVTRRLTGLAAGKDDTDAVNVSQLKAMGEAGLKFGADGPGVRNNVNNPVTAAIGKQVNIISGNLSNDDSNFKGENLKTYVSQDKDKNTTITIGLNKDLRGIDSIGNGVKTGSLDPMTKIELSSSKNAVNIGNAVLNGVANGTISSESQEGINGRQIESLKDILGADVDTNNKDVTKKNLFTKSTFIGIDTQPMTYKTAIEKLAQQANSGLNIKANVPKTANDTNKNLVNTKLGKQIDIVAVEGTSTIVDSNNKQYMGKNLLTAVSAPKDGDAKIEIGFKDDPEFKTITLEAANSSKNSMILDGSSIKAKTSTGDLAGISFDTDKINLTGSTKDKKPIIANLGSVLKQNDDLLKVAELKGLTDNEKLSSAATIGDIKALANGGLTFKGDINPTTSKAVSLASDVNIKKGDITTTDAKYMGENLLTQVDNDGNTISIGLKESPKFKTLELANSDAADDKIKFTVTKAKEGTNKTSTILTLGDGNTSAKDIRLSGIADAKANNDAVNLGQLTALGDSTIKISGDNTKSVSEGEAPAPMINRKLSEGLNIAIKGATNSGVSTKIDGNSIEIMVAKATKINDVPTDDVSTQVEKPSDEKFTTEKAVVDYVKSKTENLNPNIAISANSKKEDGAEAGKESISLKDGLNFKNGANTIASITKGGDVSFALSSELTGIKSIAGEEGKGKITFGDRGTEGSKISTVQFNDAVLTGIANGTNESDAVNVKQLKSLGIDVGKENAKSVVTYDNTAKTVVTLAGDGGTTLGGLKDGNVEKDSKEAVTGGQLHTLETALGTTNLKAPTFTNKAATFAGAINENTASITTLGNKIIQLGGDNNSHTSPKSLSNLNEDTFVIKGATGSGITTTAVGDNITINIAKTIKSDDIKNATNTVNTPIFTRAVDVKDYVTSEISVVTEKITDAKIAYSKKGDKETKKVKLTDGLVFDSGDNLTLTVGTDGIKYSLNNALSGITSISGGAGKGQLTFDENNVVTASGKVGLTTSGNIVAGDKYAVTGEAVKAALTEVQNATGDDSITIAPSQPNANGKTTYTVALKTEYKNKLDKLANDPEGTYVKKTAYNVGEDINVDKWKEKLGVSNLDLTYSANGDIGTEDLAKLKAKTTTLTQGLKFNGDNNLTITTGEKGEINYSLSSKLKGITSINNKNSEETPITIGDKSIEFGNRSIDKITSGSISTGDNKAVTGDAVYDYLTKNYKNNSDLNSELGKYITKTYGKATYATKENTISLTDNSGASTSIKIGENKGFTIVGNNDEDFKSGKNIQTTVDNSSQTLTITLSKNPKFSSLNVSGVTISSKDDFLNAVKNLQGEARKEKLKELGMTEEELGKLETGVIHANGFKIAHIADGEVTDGSMAAVNGGQLFKVKQVADEANSKTKTNEASIGENIKKISSNTVKIEDNIANIKKNSDTIVTHTSAIQGINTKLESHGKSITANKENIDKGLKLDADTRNTTDEQLRQLALGDTIKILGKDNISTKLEKDGEIYVALNNNIVLRTGDKPSDKLTINENNSGKISGLTAGIADTDAINLGQLKPLAKALNMIGPTDSILTKPTYNLGDKESDKYDNIQDALTAINTTAKKGAEGKIGFGTGNVSEMIPLGETVHFDVDTNGNTNLLTIDYVKTGNVFNFKVSQNPTFSGKVTATGFDANNKKITNVSAGEALTDAVNLQQLNELKSSMNITAGNTVSLTLNAPVAYKATVRNRDTKGNIIDGEEDVIVFKSRKDGDKVDKYYRKNDVGPNGKISENAHALTEDELKTLKVASLNKEQGLGKPLRFTNIAEGDLNSGSTDAINGSQIRPLIKALGMTTDGNTITQPNWSIGRKDYHSVADVISGTVTGEIGTVIITDKNGNAALRAHSSNGKTTAFYKVEDIDKEESKKLGKFIVKSDAVEIPEAEIQMSILNPVSGTSVSGENGKNAKKLSNLAAGTNDYDAVNVKQLKALGVDLTDTRPVVIYDSAAKDKITLGNENKPTKITNLAAGDVSDKSTDAITGAQLNKTNTELATFKGKVNPRLTTIEKGWYISANTDTSGHNVKFGDLVTFKTDDNLDLKTSDNKSAEKNQHIFTLKLKDNIKIGNVSINNDKTEKENTSSTITGLTNTVWAETDIREDRAATEGQLNKAIKSVTTNMAVADKFAVKYDNLTAEGKPTYEKITLRGVENNGKNNGTVITNLKSGNVSSVSTDAINGSQLFDYSSSIASVIGGSTGAYDPTTGKINKFSVKINDNNGRPREVNNIKEALENLNAGWRILGGQVPEVGKLDTVAGATNIERGQSLGIFASGNISTKVTKEKITLTPKIKFSDLTIADGEVFANGEKSIKLNKEKFNKLTLSDGSTLSWNEVKIENGKLVKLDGKDIDVKAVEGDVETKQTAYVKVEMTPEPEFDKVVVNKKGVTVKGKIKDSGDSEKETAIAINTDGKGTITGLTNTSLVGLDKLTKTENKLDSLDSTRAATEGQLQSIITDYVTRDSVNVKYDNDVHNKITLGGLGKNGILVADGVALTNVKAGKSGNDAANMDQIIRLVVGDQSKVAAEEGKVEYDVKNNNWKNINYTKLHKVDGTEETIPTNIIGAINANASKIDSGITFGGTIGKEDSSNSQKQYLGSSLNIVTADAAISKDLVNYVGNNLITKYVNNNGNGTVSIGFKEVPKFKGIVVGKDGKDGTDAILTTDDKGNLVLKNGVNGKDGINGENGKGSEIVTKELLENEGLIGKSGVNGKDGVNGPAGRNGLNGPAGKDGISGANINEKVNALRNGEAGAVVYTTADGERVVRDGDKFYKASDLVGRVKDENGDWYPNKGNGEPNKDVNKANSLSETDVAKIQLSTVNKDGSTLVTTTLGNIKSDILTNKAVTDAETQLTGKLNELSNATSALISKEKELVKAEDALAKIPEGADKKAAEEAVEVAKTAVEEEKGKVTAAKEAVNQAEKAVNLALRGIKSIDAKAARIAMNSLYAKEGLDLVKAATVGDLQAVAQAGLDFGANGTSKASETNEAENSSVHKKLGDKLGILGGGAFTTEFTSDNLATKVSGNDIVIGFKANPEFKGIGLKDNSNTVNLKPIATNTLAFDNGEKTDNGVKLTNLLSGDTKKGSKDAVTGGQLYSKSNEIATLIGSKPGVEGEKATSGVTIDKDGSIKIVGVVPEIPASEGVEKVPASGGLDGKGSKDLVSAIDKIYDNISKTTSTDALSLTYKANGSSKITTLKTGLDFTDGTNTTAEIGDSGVVKFNVNKDLTGIESISRTKDKSTTKITIEDGKVDLSKTTAKDEGEATSENVVLKGLKDDKDDITSAVTRGSLNELAKAVGVNGKDGRDGVPGTQGRNGMNGTSIAGPAGKDGLNGTVGADGKPGADAPNLTEKVNALRNGEAGAVVYVDTKGERVIRDGAKFYPSDAVRAKDGKWYPAGTKFADDGETPVVAAGETKPQALDGIESKDVQLAAVSPNGETKSVATVIGNVKGTLGVNNGELATALNKVSSPATDNKENRAELANARLGGLLKQTDKESLNKVATVGDLQLIAKEGLEFAANGNANLGTKLITKSLGSRTGILGGVEYDTSIFNQDNIATMIDKKGDILIGMKKTPNFAGIELQEDNSKPIIKLTPSGEGSADKPITLTIGTPKTDKKGTEPIVLKGLKDGDAPDSAVTKETFDNLVKATGLDGKKGDIGPSGRDGSKGAIGQDGLNGKDAPNLSEKVNALRAGEAGSVVYTTDKGERVVRDKDKFYLADSVRDKDGNWYAKGTELNSDGSVKNPSADRAVAIEAKDVQLATVNPDGTTKNPTALGNIKSAILESVKVDGVPVGEKIAKEIVFGKDNDSGEKTGGLVKATGEILNRAATVGDLQTLAIAGLDFGANGASEKDNKEIHKKLGEKLGILGGTQYNETTFIGDNLATRVTTDGNIEIGFKKVPKFDEIKVQTPAIGKIENPEIAIKTSTIATEDGTGTKPVLELATGSKGTDKVVLKGLTDGKAPDSAVTKETFDKLVAKAGLNGEKGDIGPGGRVIVGTQGTSGMDGATGPAGQDGLNGKDAPSLSEKVNALRAGEAGTIVYTDKDGNRVVRDGNKFYKASEVAKLIKDGEQWYEKDKTGKADKTKGIKNPSALTADEVAKIQLAAVDKDGSTTIPTAIGNVAGNIALSDKDTDSLQAKGKTYNSIGGNTDSNKKALIDEADKLGEKAANKVIDLIGKNKTDMNKAATVGDIQSLAIAGMNYKANGENTGVKDSVHKILGTKLGILGGKGNFFKDEYTSTNIATKVTDEGDIQIGFKKAPEFAGLVIAKDGTPGKDGKDAVITVDDKGNLIVKNGANGLDGINGIDGKSGKGSEIITKETLEGLIGKSGVEGAPGVSGRDGINGVAGRDGLNGTPGANGKDAPNLSEKVNALRNGEAGTIVYTDADGNRVVRDGDKFYSADAVRAKDGNWYAKGTKLGADGNPVSGTNLIAATTIDKEKVQLATVNPDGSTVITTKFGNIESAILGKNEGVAAVEAEIAKVTTEFNSAIKEAAEAGNKLAKAEKELETAKAKNLTEEEVNAKKAAVTSAKDNYDAKLNVLSATKEKLAAEEGKLIAANKKVPAITTEKAKAAVITLLEKTGTDLTRATTVGDLQAVAQAGLDFGANGNPKATDKTIIENNETHKKLGEKLGILGGTTFTDDFISDNLATKIEKGNILIGMKKAPKFEKVELGNVMLTPKASEAATEGKPAKPAELILSTPNTDGVVLKGLIAGETPDSAVTKGEFEKLAAKAGLDGKDGKNGDVGPNGRVIVGPEGRPGINGTSGAAGQDGLNGTKGKDAPSLSEKINALRAGEAGSVVYVDGNGNRVVRDGDKFYLANAIKTKDGKWYPVGTEFDTDGTTPKGEVKPLVGIEPNDVQLATVNPDGSTIAPTIIGNVASTVAPNNFADLHKKIADATTEEGKAIAQNTLLTKAKEALVGTDGLYSKTEAKDLSKAATVGDLQTLAIAGLDFRANGTSTINNNKLHRRLGEKLGIVGGDKNYFNNTFTSDNLVTKVDGDNIVIGFKKIPIFESIGVQAGVTSRENSNPIIKFKSTGDGTLANPIALTLGTGNSEDAPVVLKGLKEGETPDSAVTKGEFDKLAAKAGLGGLNGRDGAAGSNGRDGKDLEGNIVGPAGHDGLNGKDGKNADATTIIEKVNGLRNGEAGSMVYTTAAGDRVVRDGDEFYKASEISGKVKGKDEEGRVVWYKEGTKLNDQGIPVGTNGVLLTEEEIKAITEKTPVALSETEKNNLQLAAVNPNGETKMPTAIGNVKSNIAIEKQENVVKAKKELAEAEKAFETAADKEAAKETIIKAKEKLAKAEEKATADATMKVDNLVTTTGTDLNRAATVGDLQTLAVAGMNFGANGTAADENNKVHKILGAKLGVLGKAGNYFDETYDSVNVATKVVNGDIEIGIKKSPEFNELVVHGKDGKDGKSAIITINEDGNLAVKNGLDGVNGKDGVAGVNGENAKTTEIITKDFLEKEGLVAKDGAKGVSGNDGRDGLNDSSLPEKVNALRNGEAGAIVYTDEFGNKVVRDGDNFYDAAKVKNYVKYNDKFFSKNDIGLDGKPVTGAIEKDLSSAIVDSSKIQLSAVSPDGGTRKATQIGNVESAIIAKAEKIKSKEADVEVASKNVNKAAAEVSKKFAKVNNFEKALENLKKAGLPEDDPTYNGVKESLAQAKVELEAEVEALDAKQIALDNAEKALAQAVSEVKAINEQEAKQAVNNLLTASGNTLNKVATVGDLQAVAQAGLDFVTNDGDDKLIHKPLGSKLNIEGKANTTYNDSDYSSDNLVTRNDGGVIRVAMLKSPMFDGVNFRDLSGGNKNITIVNKGGALDLSGGTDNKVVLKGIKDGDTADSVVTKGTLDKIAKEGFTIRLGGEEGNKIKVSLGDTIDVGAGSNIIIAGKDKGEKSPIMTVPKGTSSSTTETVTPTAPTTPTETSNKETIAMDKVPGIPTVGENAAIGFTLPDEVKFNKVVLENKNDKTAPKTEITNEGVKVENKNGDSTVITPTTVTTDTVVARKEVKVGPETDKDGNNVPGTTTTITKDGGITVSTRTVEKDNGTGKEVVKETSKVVINNGTITGLKDADLDDNGMVKEEDKDKAVSGGTLNQSVTTLREQVAGGLNQVNDRITNVEKRVQKVERDLQRGVANSIAQAGVKFQEIGKNQATVGAAIGSYKGHQAVAVGLQAAPTENVRVHGIISVSPNDVSESAVSVGASWKFDLK